MIDFNIVIQKIKQIEEIKSDKDFAKLINIKPDALVQRKNRNSIPHDNIIKYCLANNISIDMIYENNDIEINDITSVHDQMITSTKNDKLSRIAIFDSNEVLKLPIHNPNNVLKAYIDSSSKQIFIIDTSVDKYNNEGLYYITYHDRTYIKNITDTFNGSFQISSCCTNDLSSNSFEIDENKINELIIKGKVENIISVK
jgi:homospermidine synthase